MKKKRNPVGLAFKFWEYRKFPATNEVVKLDLEMLDWGPPYGRGRHDDLHMVFDGWCNPKDWYDFHEHLSIVFPNCVDGFYRRTADTTSGFRYDYAQRKIVRIIPNTSRSTTRWRSRTRRTSRWTFFTFRSSTRPARAARAKAAAGSPRGTGFCGASRKKGEAGCARQTCSQGIAQDV